MVPFDGMCLAFCNPLIRQGHSVLQLMTTCPVPPADEDLTSLWRGFGGLIPGYQLRPWYQLEPSESEVLEDWNEGANRAPLLWLRHSVTAADNLSIPGIASQVPPCDATIPPTAAECSMLERENRVRRRGHPTLRDAERNAAEVCGQRKGERRALCWPEVLAEHREHAAAGDGCVRQAEGRQRKPR
jgi:hypothetical protein